MLEKEYQEVQLGDQVMVTVHGKDQLKYATVIQLRRNQDYPNGGPIKIRFNDGKERWISHRFLAIVLKDDEIPVNRPEKKSYHSVLWDAITDENWKEPIDSASVRKVIGHHLWNTRIWRLMTRHELSELSGVSEKQINQIEEGDPEHPSYNKTSSVMPSMICLIKLCNALKIRLNFLIGDI